MSGFPVGFVALGLTEPPDLALGIMGGAVVGALAYVLGILVIRSADRLQPPAIDDYLASDPRAPVLFVRPFGEEQKNFKVAVRGAGVTFEDFLAAEVEQLLGPLVALGNPTDRIAPKGATRSYYSDVEWQRAVERLVEVSSCILTVPSSSANTAWELAYVKSRGHYQKLFVLTPPKEPGPDVVYGVSREDWKDAVTARLIYLTVSLYDGQYRDLFQVARTGRLVRSARLYSWTDWATALAGAGYQPTSDPGPGAVLTFDVEGRVVVLKQGATESDQYITPIQKHLEATGAA